MLLSFGLLFAAPSYARLGETPARIEARYGVPTSFENGGSSRDYRCVYTHDGFTITVQFLDDKSVSESYLRESKPLTEDEVQRLLDINARGTRWSKEEKVKSLRRWHSNSGSIATCSADNNNGYFEIVAKWWQDFIAAHPEGPVGEGAKAVKDF